jgi:predicted dehydrogenase
MERPSRRSFLNQAATLAASASTALSYSRVRGANERVSLGHIGIGQRGTGLAWIASRLKDSHNLEMTAVCDLWKVNREKAAAKASEAYGRAPRAFQYMEELLALKDVDAVIISTTPRF